MRVQAKHLMLNEQMAVLGRRSVGVSEQAPQQRKGGAQTRTSSVGLTIGPKEGSQLAAGMHAAFDRQVEQQGLRLAQGKGEAVAGMKQRRGTANRPAEKQPDRVFS